MKRPLVLAFVTAAITLAPWAPAAQFKFPEQTLTVPDGFTVERVASPPLTDRPICADFDEQGRLYIADSSGSNDKVAKQLAEKPHRIVRLEDTNGDGIFDKSVVFADKMMFPEGAMWHDGSLYVGAPPSIWKLTDTDGDGVADQREEWFQGKTLGGCANDLHGPYLGPDGWIYWCKGGFEKQTYERQGHTPTTDKAAHIFRCRPDKSAFDSFMSGGMDNPVEVAFDNSGELFFTTTFFVNPEAGKRDAIVHGIYGGVYPKVNSVLDTVKKTGDFLPPLVQFAAAAPCGLACYQSRVFGDGFENNLFACLFNLHKVSRHALEPNGSTFKTRDSDFLVSDNPDFHPTDVLEDADGSLLVLDTGGWYKLCCPTSQLAKPDVLGAIYRIRRNGVPKIADPRGLKLDWKAMRPDELAKLLDDTRPAVRTRAIAALARIGTGSVRALADTLKAGTNVTSTARRNAVWALTRIDGDAAREAVRSALRDQDASVLSAALHSVGIHKDKAAGKSMVTLLSRGAPQIKRKTATALGQFGEKNLALTFSLISQPPLDRQLEHAFTYALIDTGDRDGAFKAALSGREQMARIGIIALDQMDDGGLKAGVVTPCLNSTNASLKDAALWIAGHHPEWGEELSGYFRDKLAVADLSAPARDELQKQLAQFGRNVAIQELLAATLADTVRPLANRELVLRAMAASGLRELPGAWGVQLAPTLNSDREPMVRAAIAVLRTVPPAKTNTIDFTEPLVRLGRSPAYPTDLRLDAVAALPGGLSVVDPLLFDMLREALDPARPPLQRDAAAKVLAHARLNDAQLLQVTDILKTAGPLELTRLLDAFDRTRSEEIGLRLVAALKGAKAFRGLRADLVTARLTNFPASVQAKGQELLALLNTDAAKQKAHLEELSAGLKGGDIRRGQAIFNGAKAACATCHAIGYLGGHVGPDLTKIGEVRTERDLLESILYPSASFVRSFEPMIVVTRDGEEQSGILKRDAPDEIVLVTGVGGEVRVPRANIAELRPGTVSVMPQGLDTQLNKQELADLMAFLKSTKWGAQ